jgi:hypothetical protein
MVCSRWQILDELGYQISLTAEARRPAEHEV